jgi:hypothetical protein
VAENSILFVKAEPFPETATKYPPPNVMLDHFIVEKLVEFNTVGNQVEPSSLYITFVPDVMGVNATATNLPLEPTAIDFHALSAGVV